MHIFKNTQFDFLRWRWYATSMSALVIAAEFDGPPSVEQVRNALTQHYPGGAQNTVVAEFGDPSQRRVIIRVAQAGQEEGGELSPEAEKVENALKQANIGNFSL